MKIKLNFKTLKLRNMVILIMVVFQENSKSYSQVFLDECLHDL